MSARRRKGPREKDLTRRFLSGDYDPDRIDSGERFGDRTKNAQQRKMLRTAAMRAEEGTTEADLERLPVGEVIQVYSLHAEVEWNGVAYLCVLRRTLGRVREDFLVVGDRVRFTPGQTPDETGKMQGVIEQVLPRRTVLARAESFRGWECQPIVANAEQMLIVLSVVQPRIKWGLVDRMLVAAGAGGVSPILCLNKVDLVQSDAQGPGQYELAQGILSHYASMGVGIIETSVPAAVGLDELRRILKDRSTALAGHSGVGKSSLIGALQPGLELRTAEVSPTNEKGRHTTTSARRYRLDFGGEVIDTPGVRQFGLWNVTADNLEDFFPDIQAGDAPQWRQESYAKIAASL